MRSGDDVVLYRKDMMVSGLGVQQRRDTLRKPRQLHGCRSWPASLGPLKRRQGMISMLNELRQLLTQIEGQSFQFVRAGAVGSMFDVDIGADGEKGPYGIFVEQAVWELHQDAEPVTDCDERSDVIAERLHMLVGRRIESMELEAETMLLLVRIQDGLELSVYFNETVLRNGYGYSIHDRERVFCVDQGPRLYVEPRER